MQNTAKDTHEYLSPLWAIDGKQNSQAFELQNTDANFPIQLRVDPVTDYTALFFTLGVSILISSITAFITIWLITKSNNNLSKNQANLQEEMLNQQEIIKKNELKANNRQEWINRVRNLFIEYFSAINHSYIELQKYINAEILMNNLENNNLPSTEDQIIHSEKFKVFDYKFRMFVVSSDLLLSKDNPLDRGIVKKMDEILLNYDLMLNDLMQKSSIKNTQQIHSLYFKHSSHSKRMNELEVEIRNEIKTLLKHEWERVKNFE